jgi:hypothetical protein
MSYLAKDDSVHDAAPIECYEFIAQHKTWRYTSYHTRVQVDGDWYEPFQITRTTIEISSIIDSTTTMDFNIPHDCELAKTYCYLISPKELVVIVRSVHDGDDWSTEFEIEWAGYLAGATASGKWGTIKTASIIRTELASFLSSVFYQKSCNHVLYDARCKADPDAFKETASVVKIQGQIITVNDMVYAAGELINGVMVNVRTGERQGIISNNINVLRIGYPFFDLLVGDDVDLILGCDHQRLGDCKDRFNNVANYGGFDFIPEINPFEKLVYGSQTRTEVGASGDLKFRPSLPAVSANVQRVTSGTRRTFTGNSFGFSRSPKPVPTNQRQVTFEDNSSEGSGNIPSASLGGIVSQVLGRKRVANHNLIWTGNIRPVTETITSVKTWVEEVDLGGGYTEKVTNTETITTVTTIGYLIDMMLGICLGDDVHLVGIYVDGTRVWNGDVGPARTSFTIPAGESFLSGVTCYFAGGEYDQAPDPLIDVADFPGHVGIATILLKDIRADFTMGQMSFEVIRIPNPLGLSTGVNRTGDDLNIVSALVEVMTNEWGWGGLDINLVDDTIFTAMAVIADNEGNIVSMKIDSEAGVNEIIGALQDQGSMIIFENPATQLVEGKMIRPTSINYVTMPRFNTGNIDEFRQWEKAGWRDTLEQARGLFTERDAEYNEVPVFIQNAANIAQSGRGKKTATFNYPFVPNKALALTLLGRDMGKIAAPNYSFSLVTSRKGAQLLPGDIISVFWPDFDVINVPMLIQSVRKQELNSRQVVLALKQIDFPETSALFGAGGGPYDPGFDVEPKTPLGMTAITAPYFLVRSGNGISSLDGNPLAYPLILAQAANNFQASFNAYVNNIPGASGEVRIVESAPYPTYALLNGAMTQYAGFDTGEVASIVIDNVVNASNLIDVAEAGVRSGRLFMFIGNEILSFEDATNNGDGTWTLSSVHRALLDTVFEAHADNSPIYIMTNNFAAVSDNGFAVPVGYTPEFSVVSNGVTKQGLIADAFIDDPWLPTAIRHLAPPRPHNTKVDGNARSTAGTPVNVTEGASVTVTWATRRRISTVVALMLDAAESPETFDTATQEHHVYHRSAGGVVTEIGNPAGYVANTATFTMPNVTDGAGTIYVEAEMMIAGILYKSQFQDRIPVTVIP